jgi:hypothetical protein
MEKPNSGGYHKASPVWEAAVLNSKSGVSGLEAQYTVTHHLSRYLSCHQVVRLMPTFDPAAAMQMASLPSEFSNLPADWSRL